MIDPRTAHGHGRDGARRALKASIETLKRVERMTMPWDPTRIVASDAVSRLTRSTVPVTVLVAVLSDLTEYRAIHSAENKSPSVALMDDARACLMSIVEANSQRTGNC